MPVWYCNDGNEYVVINEDFEVVDDIPLFDPSMLPESIESYDYIDLKHNKKSVLTRDGSGKHELVVKDDIGNLEFSQEDLSELSVYGAIAASIPIYMNTQVEKCFSLPKVGFKDKENYCLLKVRGDSMIGAGIEDGDYVVIRSQNTAENRDIVAAGLGEEATLKRFMRMGDTVLLISGNENYEPIHIKSDQANIMGVTVGIIKRVNR